MAGLTCLTFNCRGWNSGSLTLLNHINSCDLCFLQEHWLFSDQLHKLSNFHVDFSSVSVSGMDSSVLLTGRPFGGCAILFRKSLSSCIAPLCCDSNRFCGIRLIDSCGVSYLLVCVYMPSDLHLSAYCDYIQILGELEVFISMHNCDVNVIVGDFNVDFDRDVEGVCI